MAPQTRTPTTAKLRFHDKLVPAHAHSTDQLLKKLKALHTELSEMDQERVDRKSLATVSKDLIHTSLLIHKDKGVKAYVACCLADLLRLYAPDAPYTANELRDIFQFFVRQLSTGLKSPDAPYYSEYFYLLESLASIKSIVLVCDLPQADELMVEIFRDFFDLVRQDMPKNVEMFMCDVLVALVDEATTLPQELLDALLAQFMQKPADNPLPAHRLAIDVCSRTAERLQRNVCQYFTDIILQGDDDEDLDRVRTAHELIKALNRDCPNLLLNVVPQLEEELRVDRLSLRTLATQVLGEMFGEPKNGFELARKYPSAWQTWLARRNDKAIVVRLAFVEASKGLVIHHPELRAEIEEALLAKLLDPDDKVRAATCRMYSELDYETCLHHVSNTVLKEISQRCVDKKQLVRADAFRTLGKLFKTAFSEIESNESLAVAQFAWIPNHIFKSATVSPAVKIQAESTVYEYLLPLPSKNETEASWTDRLLVVAKHLDDRSMQALLAMSKLRGVRPTMFDRLVDACVKNNGGVIDSNEEEISRLLNRTVAMLSKTFPDSSKAAEDFQAIAKANDARVYKLLRTCMDVQTDVKTLAKSQAECLRRIEQTLPAALDTVSCFLQQSSPWLLNQSSIPVFLKHIQNNDSDDGQAATCRAFMAYMSKNCAAIYKPHNAALTKALIESKTTYGLETVLQALAALVRQDPTLAPGDKRTLDQVKAFALGDRPRTAKFSARILAFIKGKKEVCNDVTKRIVEALPDAGEDDLVAHLAVLSQFALLAPESFETRSDAIFAHLVKNVIMEPTPIDSDDMDTEWLEDSEMDNFTRAKLLSLKICTNRCLSNPDPNSANEMSGPLLKMLWALLENGGAPKADSSERTGVKARVRLQAAISLLRLSSMDFYCKLITSKFFELAIVIQDSSFNVRSGFLQKLSKYLIARKLDARFNTIMFLTAFDPEREIREKARQYITMFAERGGPEMRVANFEMIFIRVLHLLAHHPDFSADPESLRDMAKYVEFFVDIIGTADNIALLYHLAGKAKTVRDSESDQFSENLYVMSEAAQYVIKAIAKAQQWPLSSFPGKVKLPQDIFKPHGSPEEASKVMRRTYMTENMEVGLEGIGKSWKSPNSKASGNRNAGKKREANDKKRGPGRPRKRRKGSSDAETSSEGSDNDSDGSVRPPRRNGVAKDPSSESGRVTRSRSTRGLGLEK